MSIPFPQPHPSTAPNQSAASIHSNHFPPSPILNYHGSHYHHGHRRSRSSSLVPSPTPSQAYLPPPGLAPMEQQGQGHHYRPRVHSHSSDRHHHHHHHRSRSHSQSHSPSGHGSRSVTPAPPLIISQNSEPVGPYVSVPPFQPPYAAQPPYGPTLTPEDASVPMREPSPMPTGVQYGTRSPSPQYPPNMGGQFEPPAQTRALYPPNIGGQFEPPVQTRALHPAQNKQRSRARQPLVSQELDAPEPNRRDWRIHPHFRQSRCTGKRKALCIGINYVGQSNPLHGCVDDARNIHKFLMENHRYSRSDIIVLTDDSSSPRSQPTRKNILNAMRWLVEGAHADDALFVHYSGHGGRTRDLDGDEPDGYDEGGAVRL